MTQLFTQHTDVQSTTWRLSGTGLYYELYLTWKTIGSLFINFPAVYFTNELATYSEDTAYFPPPSAQLRRLPCCCRQTGEDHTKGLTSLRAASSLFFEFSRTSRNDWMPVQWVCTKWTAAVLVPLICASLLCKTTFSKNAWNIFWIISTSCFMCFSSGDSVQL